jgi:hypothetical protein
MQSDRLSSSDSASATVIRGAGHREDVLVHGHYDVVCMAPVEERRAEYIALRDRIAAEELVGTDPALLEQLRAELAAIPQYERWRDSIDNLVTTVGKNDLLDKYLKGSAYTQTFVHGARRVQAAKAVGDTQASHAGWSEVGLANAPALHGQQADVTIQSASAGVSTSPTHGVRDDELRQRRRAASRTTADPRRRTTRPASSSRPVISRAVRRPSATATR